MRAYFSGKKILKKFSGHNGTVIEKYHVKLTFFKIIYTFFGEKSYIKIKYSFLPPQILGFLDSISKIVTLC